MSFSSYTRFAEHMEPHEVAFQLAKSGKLKQLRQYLNKRSKDERKKIVSAKFNGATSLIMGCKNGHIEVVEYLVECCNANLEQTGLVNFEGENIEGAPPLWCASAAGHLKIVKYLVSKGANVNSTTKSNSTALRAACFDGHFEIVKFLVENNADIEMANRHGHTCLMIACYKGHFSIAKYLISKGADLNRKSTKGNTALHDCAECGSLDIMKLLLSHNAKMAPDAYNMTPLLAASVTGHSSIVEYLLTRSECTSLEKVHALELLGATFVDKKHDMMTAYNHWKKALENRSKDSLLEKCFTNESNEAYDYANEFRTQSELDEIIVDPDDMRMQALLIRERILGPTHPDTTYYIRYRGAVYADCGNFRKCILLWLYALDTQQKFLEPLHPMIQSSFLSFTELFQYMQKQLSPHGYDDNYLKSTVYTSNHYNNNNQANSNNNNQNKLNNMSNMLTMYTGTVLKILQQAVEEIKRGMRLFETSIHKLNSDSLNLVVNRLNLNEDEATYNYELNNETLDIQEQEPLPLPSPPQQLHQQQLLTVTPIPTSSQSTPPSTSITFDPSHFDRTLVVIVHFLIVVAESLKHCSPEETFKLKKLVYELIKLNPKSNKNLTLLHLATSRESSAVIKNHTLSSFPSTDVLKLLLECGADPNALDNERNSALHLAAANRNGTSSSERNGSERDKLINLLLNAGTHLDACNVNNKTAFDLYKGAKLYTVINPINHLTLQCLASKVIQKYKIPYKEHLTTKLANFVAIH